MDNKNTTSDLDIVYEEIKPLDEHTHYSTDDLKMKINEIIKHTKR